MRVITEYLLYKMGRGKLPRFLSAGNSFLQQNHKPWSFYIATGPRPTTTPEVKERD